MVFNLSYCICKKDKSGKEEFQWMLSNFFSNKYEVVVN